MILGNVHRVMTPAKLEFKPIWMHMNKQKYVTFQVKTCHDAHLALSENAFITDVGTYEIALGGWENMASVIKVGVILALPRPL